MKQLLFHFSLLVCLIANATVQAQDTITPAMLDAFDQKTLGLINSIDHTYSPRLSDARMQLNASQNMVSAHQAYLDGVHILKTGTAPASTTLPANTVQMLQNYHRQTFPTRGEARRVKHEFRDALEAHTVQAYQDQNYAAVIALEHIYHGVSVEHRGKRDFVVRTAIPPKCDKIHSSAPSGRPSTRQ